MNGLERLSSKIAQLEQEIAEASNNYHFKTNELRNLNKQLELGVFALSLRVAKLNGIEMSTDDFLMEAQEILLTIKVLRDGKQ